MYQQLTKHYLKKKYTLTNLILNDISIGWLTPFVVSKLENFKHIFANNRHGVEIIINKYNYNYLSEKLNDCLYDLYQKDNQGFGFWCNERTNVIEKKGKKLFSIERAATGFLGVKTLGVHMNGYKIKNFNKELIIAKRSSSIKSYPNLLDTMVAGFLPLNYNPRVKLIEEAYEEAGIDNKKIKNVKFVSYVNFIEANMFNCKRGSIIIFDLLLPNTFIPRNNDGEVESFNNLGMNKVSSLTKSSKYFKFDSRLVAIDFLLRHSFFQNNYQELITKLNILRQDIDNL